MQQSQESSALSRPPPPLLYHLSGCNYISRFGTFAFRDRKAALSNFSSMLWYYSCEITNKKYTFWDMNWNELWILLTLNRPPPPRGGFSELGAPGKYRNGALYICTNLPRSTLKFLFCCDAYCCTMVPHSCVQCFYILHVIMGFLHLHLHLFI